MSRYLTPSKIGLLALIALYTESVVPTAASIPILSFAVSHLLPSKTSNSSLEAFHSNRLFTLSLECFQKALIIHESGIPGRTIWDLFLKKLWEIISFDALHIFFDSLASLLQKNQEDLRRHAESASTHPHGQILLSRSSPFGTFVRRAQLEYNRLQLHDGIVLWKNFVKYREPTLSMWKKRNPVVGTTAFDANLVDGNFNLNHRITRILYGDLADADRKEASVSTEDVEKLLEFQIDQMQKTGNRLPDSIRNQFTKMVQTGVTVPSLSHYVQFLDSWKAGDYPSSFDNLHRYFDYTMQSRDRTFYQYALLNLAILQADFGCFTEAIAAMQETISTARENRDMACLNYSLSWLYHFSKAHPEEIGEIQKSGVLGTEREALAFLKTKAKDANMWSLLSTCLLSEARLSLTNGESLSIAFENITKASHLNVTKNIVNAIGSQMSMQGSLFSRLGVSYLAWSYGELFMECYTTESPVEDCLHCICNSASALALKGRYDDALATMDEVNPETLRNLKSQQHWMAYSGLLKFQNKLHRGDLVAAAHFLSQLQANPASSQALSFTFLVQEVNLQVKRQDFTEAMRLLELHSSKPHNDEADILQRVKLMTMKVRIYEKAGTHEKGFSVALRAASLAYKARLLPALWEVIDAICRILIRLGDFEPATKLLQSIMPQILECEDCELAANAFLSLADAHMGMAGQVRSEPLKRKEQMTKALEYIDRSFDEFSRIEDVKGQCEMMAKKATIMHLNGDLVLANDCAAMYLDIERAAREERAS